MKPRIEEFSEKKFIGKRITMSFSNDRTFELFQSFMPRRKEIKNNIGTEVYCIQIYGDMNFDAVDMSRNFEKWAAVEVTDFAAVPPEMNPMIIPKGMYAVFLYKGAASAASETFRYIFGTWLPNSGFLLDKRPHFDVLGKKYNNNSPDSEEELWIPIKPNS